MMCMYFLVKGVLVAFYAFLCQIFFTLNKCPKWPFSLCTKTFFNTFLMSGLQLYPRALCSAWLHNTQRYDFRCMLV